ncbi:Twitching mobility protein, partial [human gut metagenome]
AAMINEINTTQKKHIITLEEPIEYIHETKKSMINQREVGEDTKSYAMGLRAALRQDPDVILVGEMRDPETIEIALRAAQTGHLVFSTLHNMGAANS